MKHPPDHVTVGQWWLIPIDQATGKTCRCRPIRRKGVTHVSGTDLSGMADGVGFEPTRRFHACRFSRPVPSTARPPIRLCHPASYHGRAATGRRNDGSPGSRRSSDRTEAAYRVRRTHSRLALLGERGLHCRGQFIVDDVVVDRAYVPALGPSMAARMGSRPRSTYRRRGVSGSHPPDQQQPRNPHGSHQVAHSGPITHVSSIPETTIAWTNTTNSTLTATNAPRCDQSGL